MGKTPKEIISWCIWKHNNQMTGQNTQTQIDKIMDKEVYPKALAQLEEYYSVPSVDAIDDELRMFGAFIDIDFRKQCATTIHNLITKRRGC